MGRSKTARADIFHIEKRAWVVRSSKEIEVVLLNTLFFLTNDVSRIDQTSTGIRRSTKSVAPAHGRPFGSEGNTFFQKITASARSTMKLKSIPKVAPLVAVR